MLQSIKRGDMEGGNRSRHYWSQPKEVVYSKGKREKATLKTGRRPFNVKANIRMYLNAVVSHNQFMTMSPQEKFKLCLNFFKKTGKLRVDFISDFTSVVLHWFSS